MYLTTSSTTLSLVNSYIQTDIHTITVIDEYVHEIDFYYECYEVWGVHEKCVHKPACVRVCVCVLRHDKRWQRRANVRHDERSKRKYENERKLQANKSVKRSVGE